ncbi:MAG: DUF937 domain-containing protein [Gammaproteobacteria bacterium]|nr:DUF937 domain-containing protein [Gammaproteobacteria bacterium]
MNLLETIMNANQGGSVATIARNFNLDESQAKSAVGALLPALTKGMQKNAASPQGIQGLIGALTKGNHQRYLDDPASLANADAIADGNGILGHLLGSKEVSRKVAADAAARTGVDTSVLKKMLPMVAAMAMGSAAKQTDNGKALAADVAGGGGLLGKLLDSDGDGSVADDLMGLAKKFF